MHINHDSKLRYEHYRFQSHCRTDLMFGVLLVLQLIGAILAALLISPRTWSGADSSVHIHIWSAILLGSLFSSLPLLLIFFHRGKPITRYTIAVAQMLFSALLIHLTGGRIETHFHVFGSLAFLAFYRDWRVIIPATIVVSLDHLVRGIFWPESVFGVLASSPWRALEHAGWVVFEDIFLIISCVQGDCEWRTIANSHTKLENAHAHVEEQVQHRTEELRQSQQRYELAIRGSRDGLWDWDLKTNHVYFAPRWKQMLGCTEDEVGSTAQEWTNRIASGDLATFDSAIVSLTEGEVDSIDIEMGMSHVDGSIRWMRCRAAAVSEQDGRAVRIAGSLSDITELKNAQEQLRRLAQHDRLTDLPNRELFGDRVQRAIVHAKQAGKLFAVLFFDFDRFKVVNDSLGHDVGDELLKSIAHRFNENLKQGDVAARFGGDEFVMLLNVRDEQHAMIRADRFVELFSQPHQLEDHEIVSTASVGMTLWHPGYEDAAEMVRDADAAMYVAKENGKSQHRTFDKQMVAKAHNRLSLEEDLRRATKEKTLALNYQPIVSLSDGTIHGAEALARWEHPQRGLVSPEEFITIAEETGLIIPIGEQFLRDACEQVKQWNTDDANPIYVNVNLAQRQLIYPGFVNLIGQVIRDSGITPDLLRLEITESAVMDARHDIVPIMHNLRDLGVQLAMDDFGTGYSSLSSLHIFPINILKVDRSFITNMSRRRKFAGVMQAIVTLAHNLDLEVVGEGIETQEQIAMLQAMECNLGQGYVFARPMPAEEFARLLKENPLSIQSDPDNHRAAS